MNEQLAAIKARREAVTPGDFGWYVIHWNGETGYAVAADKNDSRVIIAVTPDGKGRAALRNMEFIAAAPADIDTLLAEVERLTGERDAARRAAAQVRAQLEQHGEGYERTHT